MVTPSFLPNLALDFTSGSLDNRITFTRTTGASNPATYVNSSGLVTAATNNQPRFDYDPITLLCKGLLVEEQRTNLFTYSEQFNDASWSKTNMTVTANAEVSPSGTLSADKLVENTASNVTHRLSKELTKAASVITYTFSFYAKAAARSKVNVLIRGAATGGNAVQFQVNLDGTQISAPTAGGGWVAGSASSVAVGNGWYRLSFTATSATETSLFVVVDLMNNSNATAYTGDGTSGIFIWGAQLEVGAFPTSYIPTVASTVTRNADVATIVGANFSSFWQTGFGGATVQALPSTVSGIRPLIQFDDGTANEIIALRGNTTNPELYIVDGGAPQAQIDAGTIASNTAYSLTGWWAANDCKARKDSGAVVTDTTATIPTVTQARLGSDGTNYLNGHLATINYYDQFSGQIYTRRKNKAVFNVI